MTVVFHVVEQNHRDPASALLKNSTFLLSKDFVSGKNKCEKKFIVLQRKEKYLQPDFHSCHIKHGWSIRPLNIVVSFTRRVWTSLCYSTKLSRDKGGLLNMQNMWRPCWHHHGQLIKISARVSQYASCYQQNKRPSSSDTWNLRWDLLSSHWW